MEDDVDPVRAARIEDQAAAEAKWQRIDAAEDADPAETIDALERAGLLTGSPGPMSLDDLPARGRSGGISSEVDLEHDRGGREQDVFDKEWLGVVGPAYDRFEVMTLLGLADEEDLAIDPRLLPVRSPDGRTLYPTFQFDDGSEPVEGVGEVRELLEIRREPELETARWLVTPHRDLGGITPISALRSSGGRDAVVHLAAEYALRSTTHITWDDGVVAAVLGDIKQVGTARALAVWAEQTATFVVNAAQIEGSAFSIDQVRALLRGGVVEGRTDFETTQILDLAAAHRELGELVASGEFQLDKATSGRLHRTLAVHEALDASLYRGAGSVTGGGHVRLADGSTVEGVPAGRGGRELRHRHEDLLTYIDSVDDPRLAGLVYAAATIRMQPYFDGNKRISTLMLNGVLTSNGYQAVSVPVSRQPRYNEALDELFRSNDATDLVAFLASCVIG